MGTHTSIEGSRGVFPEGSLGEKEIKSPVLAGN